MEFQFPKQCSDLTFLQTVFIRDVMMNEGIPIGAFDNQNLWGPNPAATLLSNKQATELPSDDDTKEIERSIHRLNSLFHDHLDFSIFGELLTKYFQLNNLSSSPSSSTPTDSSTNPPTDPTDPANIPTNSCETLSSAMEGIKKRELPPSPCFIWLSFGSVSLFSRVCFEMFVKTLQLEGNPIVSPSSSSSSSPSPSPSPFDPLAQLEGIFSSFLSHTVLILPYKRIAQSQMAQGWGLLADNMPPQFHTKKYLFGVEVFYTETGDCKRCLVWGGGDVEGAVKPPKEVLFEKISERLPQEVLQTTPVELFVDYITDLFSGSELETYSQSLSLSSPSSSSPSFLDQKTLPLPPLSDSCWKRCRNCRIPGCTKTCSKCGFAKYCSRTCQKDHWPTHKKLCHLDSLYARSGGNMNKT